MQVHVQCGARPTPFLRARDAFRTEFDLDLPVKVTVRADPDARTRTTHPGDHHLLVISRAAATSGMARELALHEFSHMYRHEEGHASHHLSTAEAIYLSVAGREVTRDRIAQCYQIANHVKDIYADDLTVRVTPTDKLVAFLESSLAAVLLDAPGGQPAPGMTRVSPASDASIAAVNAAFALGLIQRHDLVDTGHHVFDLAHIVASDAPHIPFERFSRHFRTLASDPDESTYRRMLVDLFSAYLGGTNQAAD